MPAAIEGCRFFGAVRCSAASVSSDRLSPILPMARTASSCSGPSSLAMVGERRQRVCGLVIAQRLDDPAAEEVLAFHHQTIQHVSNSGVGAVCGERAGQGGTHELGLLARKRIEQPRQDLRVDVVLEVSVGRRSKAIVGRRERLRHDVARTGIVEPGEQDERAEPDVAVGVAGDGLEQRGNRGLHRGAPDRPRRSRAGGVIDGRELVDRALQLLGGNGGFALFRAELPPAAGRLGDRPDRRSGQGSRPRCRMRARVSIDRFEGELEIRLLVPRERDRIHPGVARRAVRALFRAERRAHALEAQVARACRLRRTSGSPRSCGSRRSAPLGLACRRRRNRATRSAGS